MIGGVDRRDGGVEVPPAVVRSMVPTVRVVTSMVATVTTMVSPALAPTWKTLPELAAVEAALMPLNLVWRRDARRARRGAGSTSAWVGRSGLASCVPLARLHGQLAHALQDAVDLVQRAFRGLHDRDAVLGVAGWPG